MVLFTCFGDKGFDLVGDGFQAFAPELRTGKVDSRDCRNAFYRADGRCAEKLAVFGQEAFALL